MGTLRESPSLLYSVSFPPILNSFESRRFGTLLLIKDKDVAKVVAEVVDPLVRALAYDRRIMHVLVFSLVWTTLTAARRCITERDAEPTSGDEVDEAELDALCEGMAAMTCKGINSRVWNWDLGIWWAEHDYQVTVQSWVRPTLFHLLNITDD